jgi:hypothetical protein
MIAHSLMIRPRNDVMSSPLLQQIRYDSAFAHSVNVILKPMRLQQTAPRSARQEQTAVSSGHVVTTLRAANETAQSTADALV